MQQTSFPPNAILVTSAGLIGASAFGAASTLTAEQSRTLIDVYSTTEVDALVGGGVDWTDVTGTPTTLAGYGITDAQPLDSDLTAIAALTTTTHGRSLLTGADAAASRTTLGLGTMATQAATSYLALSGGTLTGTLNGITATWSSKSGIGTTSPTSPAGWDGPALHIEGGANFPSIRLTKGGKEAFLATDGSSSQFRTDTRLIFITTGATSLEFWTNSVQRIFVGTDGTTTFYGGVAHAAVTFAVLNATAAGVGAGVWRVTDRGNKLAYPDGTNWRWVGDDSIIS